MSDYNEDSDVWPDPVIAERIRQRVRQECDLIGHVVQFHIAGEIRHGLTEEIFELRKDLIEEEVEELANGMGYDVDGDCGWERMYERINEGLNYGAPNYDEPVPRDLPEIADACVDLVYVCLGTLIQLFGEPCARELWLDVQQANMRKFPGGKIYRNANGKVSKPPGWEGPKTEEILRRYGHMKDGE